MRVLHFICPSGFYGAERWILALANNLDIAKVSSVLAVTRESADFPKAFVDEFKALDLPVHELSMDGRFDLRVLSKLSKLIRAEKIDIIHTHGYKSDIIGLIAAKRAGIISLSTPHGFELSREWKLRFYNWLGAKALGYIDSVVPLSEQLLVDVKRLGVPDKKVFYIANGVDLKPVQAYATAREIYRSSTTQSPSKTADKNERLVVGYIGQLIDRKNVAHLLDVYNELSTHNPNVELHIVGDGDKRQALEAHASNLSGVSRIHFHGFVDSPLKHLAGFDLFVLTSKLEGVPRCLMESMAMGVPIVAYDISGVDQLITNDDTGFLVAPGNKAELLERCQAILDDPQLSRRIARNAQTHVRENFSAERMATEYAAHYQRLMDQ